jgi:putative ABC transport system substrate-binding protein
MLPSFGRVAVLRAGGDPNARFAMTSLEMAALTVVDINSADELTAAFAEMQRAKVEALLVVAGALIYSNGKRMADFALAHRLPSCHGFKETVLAGGLISLGPDLIAIGRRAASLVDKVLRGARPADLPVQQPERYEVHVNLKTAKALGIAVPASLLARADEVIE